MIIGKFIDSIFNISIIFSSFILVNTIPYVSSQEDINNSQAMQLQQMLNQSSPEQQKMVLSLLQQEAQQAIREASPEQQELMSQRSQQVYKGSLSRTTRINNPTFEADVPTSISGKIIAS